MTGWLSKAAVLWALHEAEDVPAHLLSTLIAVAACTGSDGKGAYISASTVAALTRKTEGQAKRDLRALEKKKLLRRGNQRIVAHIRADRRPVVYDLPMPERGSTDAPPYSPNGVAHRPQRGSAQAPSGVAHMPPEEFLKNSGTAGDVPRADGAVHTPAQTRTPAALSAPRLAPLDTPVPGWPNSPCCGHQFTFREASRLARDDEHRRAGREGRLLCGDPGCGIGTLPEGMAL